MGKNSKKRRNKKKNKDPRNTFVPRGEEDWDKEIADDQSLLVGQEGTAETCASQTPTTSTVAAVAADFRRDAVTDNIKVTQKGNNWDESNYEKNDWNRENLDENDNNLKVVLSRLCNLLNSAKREKIGSVVPYIFNVRIDTLNPTAVKKCIQWVIEKAHLVEDGQLLFLCATLGHINAFVRHEDFFPLPNHEQAKSAFDKLLENLAKCVRKNFWVPNNCLQLLEKSAYTLVQGCSNPGWLTFAAYFRPFFGMKYVLGVRSRMESCEYSREEYLKLLPLLVSSLPNIRKARNEEGPLYHQFLKCILHFAPDEDVVFQMAQNRDQVYRFFSSGNDREYFFMEYFKDSLNKQAGNLGDKLKHLNKISKNFPGKISSGLIFGYVQQFIDTVAEPSSDEMATVFHLISNNFSDDSFFYLLRHLSKSSSATHHNLFLQLVNDERFTQQWEKVSRSEKIKICFSWVEMKAHSSKEKSRRIKAIFEAADLLISCVLISLNENLVNSLCENVFKGLLHENCIRIIEEFKEIENYSPHVQNCFEYLVEETLCRNPHLVTKKETVKNLFGITRSQKRLLTCVLNVFKLPGNKEQRTENKFMEMLKFCDIWVLLVDAKESIGDHKKLTAGIEIWQEIEDCIMKGDITVTLLDHVKKCQREISLIFAGLHCSNCNSGDHEYLRNKYIFKINELVKTEEDVRDELSLLETAFIFGGKVLSSFGHMPPEILERKKKLREMKLRELNEDFWGPHITLLERLAPLQLVMQSVSFMNITKVCLQESELQKYFTSPDNNHGMDNLIHFFQVLSTEGIDRFEAEWNRVLLDPGSQTVNEIKDLLGDLSSEKLALEFSILEKYFKPLSLNVRLYIKACMKFPYVLDQVKYVIAFLKAFQILNPERSDLVSILTGFLETFDEEDEIVLESLHEPMTLVERIIALHGIGEVDELDEVIAELGHSPELVDFLKEIVNEDIRVFIDAVEEHSDQFVSASLVSDLIQVHGFVAPVIKKCGFTPELVLTTLVDEFKKQPMMISSMKIRQCSEHLHSLRGLYQNVANREEMTREIIANCLNKGEFDISLDDDGVCQITMRYEKDGNSSTEKSMLELHDLRSRAHLIISSDKKQDECLKEIDFADFIEQVNLLSEIEETIEKLQSSGYIKYQSACQWPTMKETKILKELSTELTEELEEWEDSLKKARQESYFLNYYWSDQLCMLYNFITNPDRSQVNFENVLTLIHFVDPTIKEERVHGMFQFTDHSKSRKDTPNEILSVIGNALADIFAGTRPILRNMSEDIIPSDSTASVKKGELYVAVLDEQSPFTANVILSLYENTTNGYPEPYQVIFCGPQTAWEEIQIFLQRCLGQTTYLPRESLFCLANVELLANEVQFELIDFIKRQEADDNDLDYQLAIICRGGRHHYVVEEFSKFQHSISGMSYSEISQRFKSAWPDVKLVTSTLPGLGKTELIHQEAVEKRMNVVTFPISGQIDQSKIIQRLKQLDLRYFHCLHFDIGEVDDPVLLDTFLFQLIVTGMVSFGTQLFNLQNTHVYIEIANSLNDRLRESLVIMQCFTRAELNWNNYSDLEVSSKITSDIQVVCQYLNSLEQGHLESMDIRFSGHQKPRPLSTNKCRELLRKYYSTNAGTTFTALNTFLGLLADQLRKFSRSAFFEIENLKLMLENKAFGVRRNLLTALLDVSKDFAARSLKTCSSSHHEPTSSGISAQHMVQRVEGMIRWEESNHLLIVFHGVDSQTIAAFYRDKNRVPREVSDLLKSQTVKGRSEELDDFKTMTHEELQERLERIARTKSGQQERQEMVERDSNYYALTPDNMLKMILITLRVRANVPIIIMGETGCGKTSLVEYLAGICQIPFSIHNFHAGRTEKEVKKFIQDDDEKARKATGQTWVFLDEINTCHHLGLINEVMCHHTLHGKPLSRKLVLIAACNPYKLRKQENATTAGLEGKNKFDEYSELVYRVHPLPEAMMDYVWDYGSLTPEDEKSYIRRMVQNLPTENQQVLVDLLAESQKFIRESEKNPFCVSLRDVRRCILLVEWFIDMIKKRTDLMNERLTKGKIIPDIPKYLEQYKNLVQSYNGKPVIRSFILALAHCYLSRLQTETLREEYIRNMTRLFPSVPHEDFVAIIRMEQEDYLSRMELPPGTARNSALRENVFVMLVSILNRIPVFVVGKPGCSKSLAIQLIRSNLRGKDSKDAFFKTLPHLYVVSYQGSESSTSEGINEIFEKASNYKLHNKDANVLPVVLLDEVGLAENSPNNPLKVLHSILEPGKGKLPDVAVVGISNWALDAAKMNRAIHLSRPEPTVKDLTETAISLYQGDDIDGPTKTVLSCLANAYYQYQSKQGHANFHGLRDYYSLVKSLSANSCDVNRISVALQRNFGGIPVESSKVQEIFTEELEFLATREGNVSIPVTTLIQENLDDLKARHLMLITNGDSAIGILKQNLSQSGKETITIFGSRFEEDISDDYNYRMLSRIILCMERDCVLILRDLECIYGSLYDMLNQNYAVVGKRKNCRVALGANSNPMCYVNDGFRCIVLVDCEKVDYSDPPFLNRFEKQLLRFSDVLNERQQGIVVELQSWVFQMSHVEGLDELFKESDMFMGFHEDTLPSLVLLHSNDTDEANEEIVKKCKDDLMWIATPDGVLRTQKCERLKEDRLEVNMLADEYFEKPIHNGLSSFLKSVSNDQVFAYTTGSEIGSKTIIMTHATIHTDINRCLDDGTSMITYQLERLGYYKSAKRLEDRIHNFFSSDKKLLVFQCRPEFDGEHMLLARSVIDEKMNSYVKKCQESNSTKMRKHVCILVHVRRADRENTARWQFNFLSGWKQVFLDALEVPSIAVNEMRNETIDNLLTETIWSFQGFAKQCILWCFTCINYTQNPRKQESVLQIAKGLFVSEKVTTAIQKIIVEHVSPINDAGCVVRSESWQVKVACDIELLLNSSTLSSAMEQYLSFLIRQPLAKIVYFLERENAWPPHLFFTDEVMTEWEDLWCDLLQNTSIFNINEIPECLGADAYSVGGIRSSLKVPFSQVIFRTVNVRRSLFMKEYAKAMENGISPNDDRNLAKAARLEQLQRYSEILRDLVPCIDKLPETCLSSYMADILDIISADFYSKISCRQRVNFSLCAFLSFAKQWLPIKDLDPLQFYALLHLFVSTSRDKINDLLQLVCCCEELVNEKRLEDLTKDFFSANQGLLPFSEHEIIDERINALNSKAKSSRKYSEASGENSDSESESDESTSDSEESDSGESDDDSSSTENEAEYMSDEDEEKCFEDIMLTLICEKMFPSEKTVSKDGGLESWIRNSSLLPSSSLNVSNDTPAYHFLSFCLDYAKIVQSTGISVNYHSALNKIAKELKPEYLNAENSLQVITEALIKPVEDKLRGQEENHVVLQKFLSQFYSRCLETNVESKSARLIIEHVLSLHGDEVIVMTPVIYRLLFAEQEESPCVFFEIIIDHSQVENYPCLRHIDDVFRDRFAKSYIHHDSYAAVMICDLIYSIQKFDQHFNMEQLKNSDSKLLKIFRSATSVLTGSESNTGLVLLSSVAFLRAFYSMLSKQSSSILTTETQHSHVMGEINSLLAAGDARISTLRIFFLKQLYGAGMSMFDLRKLCCESDQLPVIKNQFEDSIIVSKVEFVSVYRLLEYEVVRDAYMQLNQKNDDEMLTVLTKCQNCANYQLALLEFLISVFYVKKATGNLSDKEERLVDWFSEKSKDLPSPMKELLLRIIGRENFKHHGLQISLESSTVEIETALLILHVSCVVASRVKGEISPLLLYFSNPEKCHGTCVLAHGEDRKRRVYDQFTSRDDPPPVTCSCQKRIKCKDDQEQAICPYCLTKPEGNECEATSFQQIKTYYLETKSKEWQECTENMDASVYRALHLIVYACLYAGVATGISSSEAVSLLLSPDTHGSTSGNLVKDSANFCFNRIKDDLQYLMTILSCKSRTAVDVMHLVVEKCTELIQGKTFTNVTFSTREECVEWENRFKDIAEDILPNALQSARTLKEMMFEDNNQLCSLIETQIQELDEYPSDPEQQNAQLKRLFRVTKQPSFSELRSMFLNDSKEFQEQHSVLAVLLSKFDELPYLACLYPLLQWSRLVSSALTHHISRKEAESLFINDFIEGDRLKQERSREERDELRDMFKDFKVAWNKMQEFVNENLEKDEMPDLTDDSYIGFCLTDGDLSIYLKTAIKILQSIQNDILDGMILTSMRTRHPALGFLEKNETCWAVMAVSLQEAKKKDIINFDWSNKFMKYAQNPDYGCGEEIDYDFERMEIELAKEVVLAKSHLTDNLNTFIFSKELFHSSAKMLTKVNELCPQSQSLPDEIRQGLHSLNDRRRQDARNLLQHIEVIIYVLSMKSVASEKVKEMTLENFAEEWKSKLPSPFPVNLLPEPKGSIRLTHIAVLYEALEDLLADGRIEGLPRQFKKEMTEETKGSLNTLVDNRKGSLKLKHFLTALRRFVFRYLSAEKFFPEPHKSLRFYLKEPSLWSPNQPPDPDVIPEEMMLENIHAIITHLTQEQRGYSSARSQVQQRNQPGTRRPRKRRVIANFTR